MINGPTASGKSALAVQLAQKINGSVVNADSIQVYRDLQVLSARPSAEEMQGVVHHLFGYMDAYTNPSLADWLEKVADLVPNLENPVLVGGTGMYTDALINGVSPVPDIPEEVRQIVRQMPPEEIKKQLPNSRLTDPQRLSRQLEVLLATGKTLNYFYELPKKKYLNADFHLIHLLPPREKVYAACDTRFNLMLEQGALEEVQHLNEIQADGGVLKAIGVPEIKAYLAGKITKEEMTELATLATRHYAKRQMTWFRHHGTPKVILENPKEVNWQEITK